VESCSTDQTDRRFIPNGISRVGMPTQRSYTEDNDASPEIMKNSRKLGESSILDRIHKGLRTVSPARGESSLRLGIGDDAADDAALWRPQAGYETILTCDWFLEGTHFLANRHPPEAVGYKCLARAVSDIAAMGGAPRCYLLSLALPDARSDKWLHRFLNGLRKGSRMLGCPIAGGDTTRRNEILINITVIGEARRGRAILRSGAGPGDAIFVTGRLGEAQYGLRLLLEPLKRISPTDQRLRKHFYPAPRLGAGLWLANHGLATAMMDLSDGLSSDLPKLCEASRVGARIEAQALPRVKIEKKYSDKFDAIDLALHGGDDYELLFTVARKNLGRIPKIIAHVPVTRIGEITANKRVVVAPKQGAATDLENKGWDPFR
jgi:thiamine-monophosphate kinase